MNSVQTVVNIFDPRALDCLAPRAAANNVALIARGVLDESGLAGIVDETTDFAVGDFRREFFTARTRREYVARIDELRAWVPGTAPSLAALAIRFVLSQPQVTSAIVSMQTEDLVRQNMALLDDEPFPATCWTASGQDTGGLATSSSTSTGRTASAAGLYQAAGMSIGAKRRANRHSPSSRTSSSS